MLIYVNVVNLILISIAIIITYIINYYTNLTDLMIKYHKKYQVLNSIYRINIGIVIFNFINYCITTFYWIKYIQSFNIYYLLIYIWTNYFLLATIYKFFGTKYYISDKSKNICK